MNCCRETAKMGVPPGNRRALVSVPGGYVAGTDSRGRQGGRPYPWSQQVIHEISGLGLAKLYHDLPENIKIIKCLSGSQYHRG